LRLVTFENNNTETCIYSIHKGTYSREFIITNTTTVDFYLKDGYYILSADATNASISINEHYVTTSNEFLVMVGMIGYVGVTLDTFITTPEPQPVYFLITSSLDGSIIDPKKYLNIYIDGILVYLSESFMTTKTIFNLTVTDRFGIIVYEADLVSYSLVLSFTVPLRLVTFYNDNQVHCYFTITKAYGEVYFWVGVSETKYYYLSDGDYDLVATPGNMYKEEGVQYLITSKAFEVAGGMDFISVTLKTFTIEVDIDVPGPISFNSLIDWFYTGSGRLQTLIIFSMMISGLVALFSIVQMKQNMDIKNWLRATHLKVKRSTTKIIDKQNGKDSKSK